VSNFGGRLSETGESIVRHDALKADGTIDIDVSKRGRVGRLEYLFVRSINNQDALKVFDIEARLIGFSIGWSLGLVVEEKSRAHGGTRRRVSKWCFPPKWGWCHYVSSVSWLSRGPDSSGEVWIGCKRLILKLSGVLLAMEVKGSYIHANQRLILIRRYSSGAIHVISN
jgi:hypothetical protein